MNVGRTGQSIEVDCRAAAHRLKYWARSNHWRRFALVLPIALLSAGFAARPSAASTPDLTNLSVEELMNVDVTLAARHPEARALASSPIYVISQDDIRRSGFTTIADALRLAPGTQVARLTADEWAVGIRGFGSQLSRSVLALMDGRSLYTPLFAGTYWEIQDTVLDDIDRIEIVRGPGGALWGSNAVNGVINIVTKSPKDTQGLLLVGGGGSEERGFGTARYGGKLADNIYYRVYGKYVDRTAFSNPNGPDFDGWRMGRGGFRVDWDAQATDRVTFQGDAYDGHEGESVGIARYQPPFFSTVAKDADVSGANLLGRWTHDIGIGSNVVLQSYYDHTFRREANFTEERNTYDIDLQHQMPLFWQQNFLWGIDYRVSHDATQSVPTVVFDPRNKTLHLASLFLQDELWLLPDTLRFTFGSKFEYSTYADFTFQPSGSLLWSPLSGHSLWASISRAVRTPSRIEHDLFLTANPLNAVPPDNQTCVSPAGAPAPCTYPRISRNLDFKPETLVAYQAGYRAQPFSRAFFDVAAFYNEHHDLLSLKFDAPFVETDPALPHVIVPIVFANALHGSSYGFEVSGTVEPTDWWRLSASYSFLEIALSQDGIKIPDQTRTTEGASPQNQFIVQSKIDAPWSTQVDTVLRYVDHLSTAGQMVPSYVTFDVRVAKRIVEGVEVAAVGQNLAEAHHREFAPGTEVPRGAYGQVRFQW